MSHNEARGRVTGVLLVLCTLICPALTAGAAAVKVPEFEVKAAFLRQFANLVSWPDSSFPKPDRALMIGILGQDPFGENLEKVLAGKTAQERPLELRRFAKVEEAVQAHCHLLFIVASEKPRLAAILARVKGLPILTVADAAGFGAKGVMINLGVVNGRVNFEVNARSVRDAGLDLDAKLLDLAVELGGRSDAAILRKFAIFVKWPAACFETTTSPLVVGVLGRDPFGDTLDQALGGKRVQGRPFQILRFTQVQEALKTRCHLLFIASSERHDLGSLMRPLKQLPILTVAETDDPSAGGVLIGLLGRGSDGKFAVDLAHANAVGLSIDSELLELAVNHPKPPTPGK